MTSSEIKAAIRAVVTATKAELATGQVSPNLRSLTEQAIAAAERAVATGVDNTQTRAQPRPSQHR